MIRHEIERHLVQPQEMEIVLYLDPMLYWFNGHFAVQPLLPGVAQLDWVMAPLIPETTVTLQLTWQETSQVLTFCYQRHDGDARHTASSGKIRLCR